MASPYSHHDRRRYPTNSSHLLAPARLLHDSILSQVSTSVLPAPPSASLQHQNAIVPSVEHSSHVERALAVASPTRADADPNPRHEALSPVRRPLPQEYPRCVALLAANAATKQDSVRKVGKLPPLRTEDARPVEYPAGQYVSVERDSGPKAQKRPAEEILPKPNWKLARTPTKNGWKMGALTLPGARSEMTEPGMQQQETCPTVPSFSFGDSSRPNDWPASNWTPTTGPGTSIHQGRYHTIGTKFVFPCDAADLDERAERRDLTLAQQVGVTCSAEELKFMNELFDFEGASSDAIRCQ